MSCSVRCPRPIQVSKSLRAATRIRTMHHIHDLAYCSVWITHRWCPPHLYHLRTPKCLLYALNVELWYLVQRLGSHGPPRVRWIGGERRETTTTTESSIGRGTTTVQSARKVRNEVESGGAFGDVWQRTREPLKDKAGNDGVVVMSW